MPIKSGISRPYARRRQSESLPTYGTTPALPAVPNTPSPASGGDNVYYELGWQAAGATQHDVYLSKDPWYAQTVLYVDRPVGNWRLGDVVGSPTAIDSTGNGNTGTIIGGVTFGQPGPLADGGSAALFASGVITTAVPVTAQITCAGWVYPTSVGLFLRIFSSGISSFTGSNFPFELAIGAAGELSFFLNFVALSPGWITSAGTLTLNAWTHVAMTWDGTTLVVYKNGVAVYSNAAWAGNVLQTGSVMMGSTIGPGSFWAGMLGELAVYNYALSPAQVANEYALRNVAPTKVGVHIAAPEYALATALPGPNTYYWQVVAFNAAGQATGPIWTFQSYSQTKLFMKVAGTRFEPYYRRGTLNIHDAYAALPNTGNLVVSREVVGGEGIRIGLGGLDTAHLIFGGEMQTPVQEFDEVVENLKWPTDIVDYAFELNKKRPFGTWTNISATLVAREITPSPFTTLGVQEGLPAVTVTFDGTQDFMSCLNTLAVMISDLTRTATSDVNYFRDIYLGFFDGTGAPDALNSTTLSLLRIPEIRFTTDLSQVRTRFYGKGRGTTVPCDLGRSETLIPVLDITPFNVLGGQAIAGVTPEGAQGTILTYAGTQSSVGGTLVGPGATPPSAPIVALASGNGLGAGVYQYAYTDLTAAGESLPSPLASVTTGVTAAPLTAPTIGAATAGSGPDDGNHDYEVTFVTSTGETTAGPASSSATTSHLSISAPSTAPTAVAGSSNPSGYQVTGSYRWAVSFSTGVGQETLVGPWTSAFIPVSACNVDLSNIPIGPAGTVARNLYIEINGGAYFRHDIADNVTTTYTSANNEPGSSLPVSNTSSVAYQVLAVSAIPVGGTAVTSRKLYRRFNGSGTYKLVTTIANNTTTTFSDTVLNASLGAAAPSSNTATARQVNVSAIAAGSSTVTSRKLYRTAVDASQLKLVATIADNVTLTYLDVLPDSSLGANAPTGDTSGLTQPSGQVNAGSSTLILASPGNFYASGGWVTLSGGQTVRYTGILLNTLIGIPAIGPGAITTTVLYGSPALPTSTLVGVNSNNGLFTPMLKGSKIHIFLQRDDTAAQAALSQLQLDEDGNPTDGIHEDEFVDERYDETTLSAKLYSLLAKYSMPILQVNYETHDPKSKSGVVVQIDMLFGSNHVNAGFLIQDVYITDIDVADNVYPRYKVTATSSLFTLQNLLQNVQLK